MRSIPVLFLAASFPILAQNAAAPLTRDFVRENYTKFEYRIPMRDGVNLFTSVYVPKDVFSDNKTYPILMQRTGYGVPPYGIEQYRANLGPSDLFAREKFIFVYQDVRGRYMSEGDYVVIRPHKPVKNGPKDIDENSDTYDTIEWLIHHVPGNTGKVGHVGHFAAGLLCQRGHDRCPPRAGRGLAPGPRHRLLHGRRRRTTTAPSCWPTASISTWVSAIAKAIPSGPSPHCPSSSAHPTATTFISRWARSPTRTKSTSNTNSRCGISTSTTPLTTRSGSPAPSGNT